jgi:hypothetical protein
MSIKTYIINSNQAEYTDSEFSAIQTELYDEGVLNQQASNNDLEVIQHGAGDMTVDIRAGGCLIDYLKNGDTWKVITKNNATVNKVISANAGGTNRVDAVIVHLKQTEPNSLKNNVAEIVVVTGTGITALTDGDIDTAEGDTNWYRLADITVVPAATQILTADITDTRTPVAIGINTGGYQTIFHGNIVENPMIANLDCASFQIQNTGDIYPDVDSTRDIGTPLNRYDHIYADYFDGDGSGITGVGADSEIITLIAGENINAGDELTYLKFTSFAQTDKTYVDSANPTTNYNASPYIYTATTEKIYIHFPVTANIPVGATVEFAELTFTNYAAGSSGNGGTAQVSIPDTDWVSTTLTWNNQPAGSLVSETARYVWRIGGGAGDLKNFHDVTNLVQGIRAGTYANNGFRIFSAAVGAYSNTIGYTATGLLSVFYRETGKVYKFSTSTDRSKRGTMAKYAGIAIDTVSAGDPVRIRISGRCPEKTGLTPGAYYYAQNNNTISTTPDAILSVKIGKSDADGNLILFPNVELLYEGSFSSALTNEWTYFATYAAVPANYLLEFYAPYLGFQAVNMDWQTFNTAGTIGWMSHWSINQTASYAYIVNNTSNGIYNNVYLENYLITPPAFTYVNGRYARLAGSIPSAALVTAYRIFRATNY